MHTKTHTEDGNKQETTSRKGGTNYKITNSQKRVLQFVREHHHTQGRRKEKPKEPQNCKLPKEGASFREKAKHKQRRRKKEPQNWMPLTVGTAKQLQMQKEMKHTNANPKRGAFHVNKSTKQKNRMEGRKQQEEKTPNCKLPQGGVAQDRTTTWVKEGEGIRRERNTDHKRTGSRRGIL
ncbi:hypothetical protein JTE90_013359 [Oedothorax gibbosus]|uniref:Uncharacterized protein n=1 Tax=Oedothorax gibbosus TaxID=931172 RepID=A0AAV6TVM9_9ARAC|nr:hypothetical protein JTE90_013359 [Oedothorax gibbosus]